MNVARQNGKSIVTWEEFAAKIRKALANIKTIEQVRAKSKAIRKSSYRKTKSQRRRRS